MRSGLLFALFIAAACSESSTPTHTDTAPAPAPAPATATAPATAAGVVVGSVRWRGAKPPMKSLPIDRSPEVCGRRSAFEALTVSAEGGVADAVISIDADGPPRAPSTVVLDQVACRYVPHVLSVGVGSTIEIRNSDELLHNVHATWAAPDPGLWFNLATPTKGFSVRRPVARAGVAHVACDAGHTWMSGFVHAFAHALHAVTAADGAFRIEGVPVGTRTVRLWHEGWRVEGDDGGRPRFSAPVVLTRELAVTEGEARADFELSNEALPAQ